MKVLMTIGIFISVRNHTLKRRRKNIVLINEYMFTINAKIKGNYSIANTIKKNSEKFNEKTPCHHKD